MTAYVVALIGGVGAGKTTVLNIFRSLGVMTLSADNIARELVEPSTPALSAIIKHFGKDILNADNTLNRRALRSRIFESPDEKKWLEDLLHPQIRQAIEARIQSIKAPYCMIEIPLLTTKNDYPYVNRILLVKAKTDSRIQRVSQRDDTSPDEVKNIIDTQIDDVDREALSDDVIDNQYDLCSLQSTCQSLHYQYLAETDVSP